ncbi:MAG: Uridylate kinase [Chlamydiales bacterium]|nr:Uridylate kinase [Chlamydiales bacterium]MCH9619681.1 Uridylate kinase [Chlamydiales bacterium]MCH9623287.1 Uridylate kinase [Chlamydiales bacterium]
MRVLLKISGETIKGDQPHGIDGEALSSTAQRICELHHQGVEVGLVIGGGNLFRGLEKGEQLALERSSADQMGMLATLMNAIALQKALEHHGSPAFVLSSFECPAIAERYRLDLALEKLKRGIVLFAGGIGHPYFTTDTAAALRASEIKADMLLKGTMHVDGVYDSDPRKNKEATRYESLTYQEYIEKKLAILDLTAITLCMTNHIPVTVFNFNAAPLPEVCGGAFGTSIGE